MKYSYNWLKELSGTKLTAEKAAEILTMHSFELEGLEKTGFELENVVVGELLEIKKHPNADKLQITQVAVGTGRDLSIVCGAHNIKVGDKVPVALVGAKLPNGLIIKEVEIRGEKSFGMLCAKDELGLGKDHSGISILAKAAKVGEKAEKYFGIKNDTVFEIKVLPDRAHDAMSHIGVAREIAALEKRKMDYDFDGLKLPKISAKGGSAYGGKKSGRDLSIQIEDEKLCPRYIGAVMENIEIKPSPEWMQERLKTCGIKAINNVVDATNYVMLELGQPLHAFDAEKIGRKIVVRRAKAKEKMILLDESEIILDNSDLLITNGETPLALAGIMGGRDSGINKNTKIIVIEAANFKAVNIRRTRTRLGLRTESSDRFEKEIDPNLTEKAITRIVEILQRTANGKLEGCIDIYPKKISPWKIKLDLNYVNNLLGETIATKEANRILSLLGIKTKNTKQHLKCLIPTFRIDLQTQEDLIEEIGRLNGYEKIKSQALIEPIAPAAENEILSFERKLGEAMVGLGFDEMYNYSFYSEQDIKNCYLDEASHFELSNPMNPDQQFVRTSLIPNILKNTRTSLKHFESFRIFEIGKAYFLENGKATEKRMLVAAEVLEKDPDSKTFFELKGALQNILESFGIKEVDFLPNKNQIFWHLGRSAEIRMNETTLGFMGEVRSDVLEKYKIGKRTVIFELDLEKLLSQTPKSKTFKSLQKFPIVARDISMLAQKETQAADIQKLIKKIGGSLVMKVEMFDVYMKENQTSLAYHTEFGAKERTLESAEVDAAMGKIISSLEKELKVEMRKN